MYHLNNRVTLALSTIVLIVAMVGAIALLAAPAGASATFSPQLSSSIDAGEKFAPLAAPATADQLTSSTLKATTTVAAARTLAGGSKLRARTASASGELATARSLLAGYIAKYPILKGATVEIGDARGYQAIAYYQSGRIVISRTHTASLERIVGHEIWHIIDWRDNGRIDWGENVPPR